ncbi:MAG: gliding motility-associated C-terminal domain-containing protein [Lentimicrobium sp.]
MKRRFLYLKGIFSPFRLLAFIALIFFSSETAFGQAMVVSSYFNSGGPEDEWSELLVIQDNLNIGNWTFRDHDATQNSPQPAITFLNGLPLWSNLRAGTIIIIWHRAVSSTGVTRIPDLDPSDGYIELSAQNSTYFSGGSFPSQTLNVAASGDFLQIRNASGTHVHGLGHQTVLGSGYTTAPLPKLNHSEALGNNEVVMACPQTTAGPNINQYGTTPPQNGTFYTARSAVDLTFGLPNVRPTNTTTNSIFWRSLRHPSWPAPTPTFTIDANNTAVTLNWDAATDPYSNDNTIGYIILRNTVDVFSDPVDGNLYNSGDLIGSAVVVNNILSSIIESYTDNISVPCIDGLYYRIYAYRYTNDVAYAYNIARGRAYNETPTQFATYHVTVPAITDPTFANASVADFCDNNPPADITLTADGSGPTLEWFTGSCGGTLIGTGNPLIITPPASTTTYYARWNSLNSCYSTCEDFTVTVNPANNASVSILASPSNTVCAGTPVTMTATPVSSASPSYQWYLNSTPVGTDQDTYTFTPVNGDQVYVDMTSVELCSDLATSNIVTMTVNAVPGISAIGNNPAFCGQNGSIIFNFTNVPDGAYTINYQTGSFPNVNVSGNGATIAVAPGVYDNLSITVNGCTSTENVDITITAPTGASINNVVPTGATCGIPNGSIVVTSSGGQAPVEYSIDNGTNWQSSSVFSNLAPGSYLVVVRDAALCETSWVNNPVVIGNTGGSTITQVDPVDATCGNSNGSISITASGGTAPLEYSIDNGISWQSSAVFNGLPAGSYNIIVRDGTLCETSWVNNPVVLISTGGASITQVVPADASCGSNNGSIDVTASGGTAPLEYSIDNGTNWQSSSSFPGLAAGNYNVIVRDGTLCETQWPGNPVLINNIGGATISQVVPAGTTCGNSNGSITITASGGAPLEYSIDNGSTWQSPDVFNGLSAGSYNVVVRDGTLCETLWPGNPVVLTNTSGASIPLVNSTDASCGTPNGTIVINTTGGTAPLEYSINNGTDWQSSAIFSGLPAGSYSIIVRDGASCETPYASNPVIIGNTGGAAINLVVVADASCGNSNGTIMITASGIAPLEYSINNGANWQSPAIFSNLDPGSYDIIVRDGALCLTPYASNPVLVNSTGGATINQVVAADAPCGNNSGSITITATGIAPLEYSNDNGLSWQSTPVFSNLPPGSYTVITRDGALCETLWTNNPVIINSIGGAAITQALPTNTTCGYDNGSISISAEDGVAPYDFSIDNGLTWQSSPIFNDLPAGNYNVIVRDGAPCETQYTGNPLIINNTGGATIAGVVFPSTICNGEEGMISISATDGTVPLEYSIDNGVSWQLNPDFVISAAGSYQVLVRDGSLCETTWPSTLEITVITGPEAAVTLSSDAASVCQGEDVVFTAAPVNEGLTPTYRWLVNGVEASVSGNVFSYAPANGDQVTVELTSSEICATNNPAVAEETVELSPCGFVMRMPGSFTPNGDLLNDVFKPVLGDILPTKYLLQVFDRWGTIVFETSNPDLGWDGTYKGQPAERGIYSYKVEFEIPEYISNSLDNPLRGMIVLLR